MLIAKHVLKTVCTDITNILVNFLAAELMMSVENPSSISSEVSGPPAASFSSRDVSGHFLPFLLCPFEVRVKILGKLPDETRGPLTKLHNCLNGKVGLFTVPAIN